VIFERTPIDGAYLVKLDRRRDERGWFARSFCAEVFASHGLETRYPQQNVSESLRKGTLRGMHFQTGVHAEVKLVRCARGGLFDVIVDLRKGSPSFGKWFGAELSAANGVQMYAPAGCAHGFVTLADETEATYLVSQPYAPGAEGGLRFDDPAIGIEWPAPIDVVSDKDRAWPDFVSF